MRRDGRLATDATSYLCISDAELLMPRHNSTTMPARVKSRRNRVRVTKFQSTRVGGSWALAAFQFRPPLGRSMVGEWGKPSSPPESVGVRKGSIAIRRRRRQTSRFSRMSRGDGEVQGQPGQRSGNAASGWLGAWVRDHKQKPRSKKHWDRKTRELDSAPESHQGCCTRSGWAGVVQGVGGGRTGWRWRRQFQWGREKRRECELTDESTFAVICTEYGVERLEIQHRKKLTFWAVRGRDL